MLLIENPFGIAKKKYKQLLYVFSTLFEFIQLQKAYWPLPLTSLAIIFLLLNQMKWDVVSVANSKYDLLIWIPFIYIWNVMNVKRQMICTYLINHRRKYRILWFFFISNKLNEKKRLIEDIYLQLYFKKASN